MIWVQFIISSALIVLAATQLAKYGDVIAVRTRLGGMFIGVLLLAGATSLPEVLTSINSIGLGEPNLAAGNLLGSNMFNMFLLAILDMVHRKQRLLRKAALKHALSGSLTMLMIGLVVFFELADIDLRIGWVGVDSLIIIFVYVLAIRLIQTNPAPSVTSTAEEIPPDMPSLRRGIVGFSITALALVLITPWMVSSSAEIAELTGLGADDMAIGNLFGSNLFNMFALGLTDVFYTQGRFLSVIDEKFLLVGMLGLLMTGMALIGNQAKLERRILWVELDALALMLVYFGGMWLLYSRGIG